MSGYLPALGAVLRHGPWLAGGAMLAVSPAGFALIAAVLERRLMRLRGEFTALVFGDPLLAVSVAAGAWLLRGRELPAAAGAPFGVTCMIVMSGFGLAQWHGEWHSGFYTRDQALSPTKIWHQVVVYPLLGYWLWTADLGGLLVPGDLTAKMAIAACVLAWLLANVYDRRHPKLGHPPYDWRRLRPVPRPWLPQSVSLRAYLGANGEVSHGGGTAATATLDADPGTGLLPGQSARGNGNEHEQPARRSAHFRQDHGDGGRRLARPGRRLRRGAAASPSYGAMTHGAKQGYAMSKSTNWAGYVIRPGRDVDDVSGEWTIPAVNCQQTPNALDAVWAGIGGVVSGQHLLQTGVSDSCKGQLRFVRRREHRGVGSRAAEGSRSLHPDRGLRQGAVLRPADRATAVVPERG
jgi:hypothetical protein